MAEKKIQAVIFDLGETLLNFGKVDIVSLFRQGSGLAYNFLKNLGQPTGKKKIFTLRHLLVIRFFSIVSEIIKRDFDSYHLLKKMEEKKGVKLTEKQWQDFAWCWYEPLAKMAVIESNITETLQKLTDAGLKLAILSNTFVHAVTLDRHLAEFDLLKFFPVRLYSYQFKYRKPKSKIFLDAAKAIDTKPENILFVGDRTDADIQGSAGVGMLPVLKEAYTNAGKKISGNIIKIKNISQLPEIIEKINNSCCRAEVIGA